MKPIILSREINDYWTEHSFPIINGRMESVHELENRTERRRNTFPTAPAPMVFTTTTAKSTTYSIGLDKVRTITFLGSQGI